MVIMLWAVAAIVIINAHIQWAAALRQRNDARAERDHAYRQLREERRWQEEAIVARQEREEGKR